MSTSVTTTSQDNNSTMWDKTKLILIAFGTLIALFIVIFLGSYKFNLITFLTNNKVLSDSTSLFNLTATPYL